MCEGKPLHIHAPVTKKARRRTKAEMIFERELDKNWNVRKLNKSKNDENEKHKTENIPVPKSKKACPNFPLF